MPKAKRRDSYRPPELAAEEAVVPISPAEMAVPISEIPEEGAAIGFVTITVPYIRDPVLAAKMLPGYTTRNIDFNGHNGNAASNKMLWCALAEAHAKFKPRPGDVSRHPDGSAVQAPTHGVRWFYDAYAEAVEAETGKSLLLDYGMTF